MELALPWFESRKNALPVVGDAYGRFPDLDRFQRCLGLIRGITAFFQLENGEVLLFLALLQLVSIPAAISRIRLTLFRKVHL